MTLSPPSTIPSAAGTTSAARTARPRGPVPSRAGHDALVRRCAGALLAGSLLLVTGWWAGGGGITDLSSIGNLGGPEAALTSLGRVTGLWASVLLLAQVLLMARVPLLERAFGQDRLAQQHRLVGFTSFNLMIAHVVLITWGYAAGALAATPRDALGPDRRLPRHAARPRRHRRPGHGRGDQLPGGAPAAALRVVAPAAPLRLPRRRARAAAPAVDRPAVPLLAPSRRSSGGPPGRRRRAVLVWRMDCRWRAACGTGCGSRRSCRRRPAWCPW